MKKNTNVKYDQKLIGKLYESIQEQKESIKKYKTSCYKGYNFEIMQYEQWAIRRMLEVLQITQKQYSEQIKIAEIDNTPKKEVKKTIKNNKSCAIDNINKKIETCYKNITLEEKKPQPNQRTIIKLLDKITKLTAEKESLQALNIDTLLISKAKQAVYTALKTIHQKTGDKVIEQTMFAIYHKKHYDDTLPLASELLNIASLTILETAQASILTPYSFLDTGDYYELVYKQFKNKNGQGTYHTPFSYTLTRINQFIHSQKNNKGRKTVANYETIKESDCIVTKNGITNIIEFKPIKKAITNGYAVELVSLAAEVEKPENGYYFSTEYDFIKDSDYCYEYAAMTKDLSAQEKIIFDMLQSGLKQVEIAEKLEKHTSTINTVISRIRKKIANIQTNNGSYAYDYEAVNKYRTM